MYTIAFFYFTGKKANTMHIFKYIFIPSFKTFHMESWQSPCQKAPKEKNMLFIKEGYCFFQAP